MKILVCATNRDSLLYDKINLGLKNSGLKKSGLKCPLTLLSLSVSTQDEDTDDPATVSVSAIIAGHARISPINEKISPPRPISLDIQTNYHIKASAASATASAEANGKIDREQQTPQEPQVRCTVI